MAFDAGLEGTIGLVCLEKQRLEKAGNIGRQYSRMREQQCDEGGKGHDGRKNEFDCSKEHLKEKRQKQGVDNASK